MKKKPGEFHTLSELELLYKDAKDVDKDIFAEMRSNLLLISGEHYQRRQSTFFKRLKDAADIPEATKIRLTKNHIQKIHKIYVNHVLSMVPGVQVGPKNDSELQDQKAAELNQAVWADAKDRHKFNELGDEFGDDFFGVGEIACKVFYDKSGGDIKAFKQKVNEKGEDLFLSPNGEETTEAVDPASKLPNKPAPGEPIYKGEFVIEPILGPNLLRAPEAKVLKKSPYLIIQKMVPVSELQAVFPEHADLIKDSVDETMMVFDSNTATYSSGNKNEVLLKEIYFRPCYQYPKGYYYFYTEKVLLTKGELPGGIFPIITQYCERVATSPRGRSIVKIMRPYQIEINRSASKMAEHQITLGDDKLLIQNGTKISAGAQIPGVRSINYTGLEPGILAGRDGSQYLNYMQSQITELYQVMSVDEVNAEKADGQIDPYALLFKSASQKKAYSRYVKRFETFWGNLCYTYLELAKIHLPDDEVVYAVGKREQINIPEFRNTTKLCYQIQVEPQAEDIESKLGKQMVLNQTLQYVGNKLEKEDIGKIIRAMPYANVEESFNDMTMDYDSATNMILALDRGEDQFLTEYDNYVYLVKRLVSRMRQADFRFLHPQIQQKYQMLVGDLQMMEAERQRRILAAQSEYIPTGGYMVTVDLYVPDPKDPMKAKRARIPFESVQWLIKQLEAQGMSLSELEKMNQGLVAQISDQISGQSQAMAGSQGPGPVMPLKGQENPQGVNNGSYGDTYS